MYKVLLNPTPTCFSILPVTTIAKLIWVTPL